MNRRRHLGIGHRDHGARERYDTCSGPRSISRLTSLGFLASTLPLASLLACGGDSSATRDGGGEPDSGEVDGAFVAEYAEALATDATHLYYANGPTLRRIAHDGGDPETVVTLPAPGGQASVAIQQVALAGDEVVFVSSVFDPDAPAAADRGLWRVAKAGGSAAVIETSNDARAYGSVSVAGDAVLYSFFTSIIRRPLAAESGDLVGTSESGSWLSTPVQIDDDVLWFDGGALRRATLGDDPEGTVLATVPGRGAAIGHDDRLVVLLDESLDSSGIATAFIEVDASTGALGEPIALDGRTDDGAITPTDVYTAGWDGVFRVPRDGGGQPRLVDGPTFAVAVSDAWVYVAAADSIVRVAR